MSCDFCEWLERRIEARVRQDLKEQSARPTEADIRRDVGFRMRRLAEGFLYRVDEEAGT